MAAYVPHKVGAFGTSGAPTLAANWSPAIVPVSTENVKISGHNNAIDGADQNLIDLALLHFDKGYGGVVASSGTPWRIDATTLLVEYSGVSMYLDITATDAYINTSSVGIDAVVLNGVNANTITRLHALRGRLTVGAQCTATDLFVNPAVASDVVCKIDGTVTTMNQTDGTSELASGSAVTTAIIAGGRVTHTAGALTTLKLESGRYVWNQGTVTTSFLYRAGAVLDLSNTTGLLTGTTIHVWHGIIERPNTLSLASGSISVLYHARGAHGHSPGDTETIG